ncbi:MAG: hypothetical protein ACYCO3_15000 [Mycobacteriales bacterium]
MATAIARGNGGVAGLPAGVGRVARRGWAGLPAGVGRVARVGWAGLPAWVGPGVAGD